jgi:hypothetical protein
VNPTIVVSALLARPAERAMPMAQAMNWGTDVARVHRFALGACAIFVHFARRARVAQ